jgi:hypothetical protein
MIVVLLTGHEALEESSDDFVFVRDAEYEECHDGLGAMRKVGWWKARARALIDPGRESKDHLISLYIRIFSFVAKQLPAHYPIGSHGCRRTSMDMGAPSAHILSTR